MTSSPAPTPPPGLAPGGRLGAWEPRRPAFLVVDVDGTLVGSDDLVRPDVAEAVRRAAAEGVRVGYATGRMHSALDELDRALELPGPHVVHNGAQVRSDGATVAAWPLTEDEVARLEQIATDLGAYAELYLRDGYLVTRDDDRAHIHWDLLGQPPRGMATERSADQDVLKATFIGFDPAEQERIVQAVADAGLLPGAAGSPVTPGLHYVNATRIGVDKGSALDAAARAAGTTLAATCAVGDGDNDLPMLAVAGTAVAMGQAAAHVHDAAHLVTKPVDEGGLALAIHAMLDLPA